MKVGLYSITYLGIWYKGPALTWREFLHQARTLGYDGVEFDGKLQALPPGGGCAS
jgi:sugar phosphate isomerase/epimerase